MLTAYLSSCPCEWKKKVSLTVFSWIDNYGFRFRSPASMVLGLNLNLIRDKCWRVLHHEWVSLYHVLLPLLFHILSSVAHFVLQTRPIVFHRGQGLENDRKACGLLLFPLCQPVLSHFQIKQLILLQHLSEGADDKSNSMKVVPGKPGK